MPLHTMQEGEGGERTDDVEGEVAPDGADLVPDLAGPPPLIRRLHALHVETVALHADPRPLPTLQHHFILLHPTSSHHAHLISSWAAYPEPVDVRLGLPDGPALQPKRVPQEDVVILPLVCPEPRGRH